MAFQLTPEEQELADEMDRRDSKLSSPMFERLGPMYFDRDAEPITLGVWAALSSRGGGYKRVVESRVNDLWISTVWLGINHSFWGGRPLIFETMIFRRFTGWLFDQETDEWADLWGDRYHTEAEAQAGHERAYYEAMRLGAVPVGRRLRDAMDQMRETLDDYAA